MISKKLGSLVTSLHRKKFRKEHHLFIAEGEKVCRDLTGSGWKIHFAFMTEPFNRQKYSQWQAPVRAQIVTEKELEKISALTTPQDILCVAAIPDPVFQLKMLRDELSLVLDNIKDPGNLGTIIRVADWFGIKNIICSETCADAFNPKTVQASMGSLFRVAVFYRNLEEVLVKCAGEGIPVYGALLDGTDIYQAQLSQNGIILIGSESHGIRTSLLPFITAKISIPSFSKSSADKADSLNAAMAAAIVCSEFRRRR